MKKFIIGLCLVVFVFGSADSQDKKKKTQQFTIERVINAPAKDVWKVVGEDFADIAKSHPKLTGSHHVEGSPLQGEGCERVCKLDDAGKKFTREKIVNYDTTNYSFIADIDGLGGLPLDASNSYMIYDVDSISPTSSVIRLTMVFRTNPAFLGGMSKGKFKKTIGDYAIAIQHHVLTGEDVNPENFKAIRKQYL